MQNGQMHKVNARRPAAPPVRKPSKSGYKQQQRQLRQLQPQIPTQKSLASPAAPADGLLCANSAEKSDYQYWKAPQMQQQLQQHVQQPQHDDRGDMSMIQQGLHHQPCNISDSLIPALSDMRLGPPGLPGISESPIINKNDNISFGGQPQQSRFLTTSMRPHSVKKALCQQQYASHPEPNFRTSSHFTAYLQGRLYQDNSMEAATRENFRMSHLGQLSKRKKWKKPKRKKPVAVEDEENVWQQERDRLFSNPF